MSTERDAMEKQVAEELGFRIEFRNDENTCCYVVPTPVSGNPKAYRHPSEYDAKKAYDALVASRLKLAGVERERACHASDYVVEGRDENETAAAKGSRVLDGRAGMPVGTVGVRPQGDAEDGRVWLDGRESAAVPSLPTGATIGNEVIAEVLDILWRDIDDLRDPKLTLVQVAAKASNAIHWAKRRAESASLKLAAADRLAEAADAAMEWAANFPLSMTDDSADQEAANRVYELTRSAILEYHNTKV